MSNQSATVERKRTGEYVIARPGELIVKITSFIARQKASGCVRDRISNLMGGDQPSLMLVRQRLVWRVPIILTSPSRGCLGTIGAIDVDARTGSLLIPPGFEEQILAHAETFAQPFLKRRQGDA